MKPIIGITTFKEYKEQREYNSLDCAYINSVTSAGGVPLLLPVINNKEDIKQYLNNIDGLIFSGGEDILPEIYGENPINELRAISTERDFFEIELFKLAYDMDKPILGICRGIQLINVASGGTLYQDIHVQRENALGHYPTKIKRDSLYHFIDIEKGSKLFDIFNEERIMVNSFHHQSVKNVSQSFRITARSYDGIIEAIEAKDKKFVVGVQWHPEALVTNYKEFEKLFGQFIDAAKSK